MEHEIDRIECAIRHIESSLEVDPWACEIAVHAMKELIKRTRGWIPIKWHDCTAEDREEYGFGEEIATVFDCDMPSDNQEILVTTSHGYVEKDVCYIDEGYSLDSGYDWIEDITAWMPLPESYKEGQDD